METKMRKLDLKKCLIIAIVVLILLCTTVVWGLLGAPIYDFGLGNAEMTGKSYGYSRYIYSNMNVSMALEPRLLVNEDRELVRAVTNSDGISYTETVAKLRVRIVLTPLNFDNLLKGARWCCMLPGGDPIDAKYIKDHYTGAWLDIPRDNTNKEFNIYILMDDGNIFLARGLFGRTFDGKDYPTSIWEIVCLDDYGEAQEFCDFLNEANN